MTGWHLLVSLRPQVLITSLVATNDSCKVIFSVSPVKSFFDVLHILLCLCTFLHLYNTSYIHQNTCVLCPPLCVHEFFVFTIASCSRYIGSSAALPTTVCAGASSAMLQLSDKRRGWGVYWWKRKSGKSPSLVARASRGCTSRICSIRPGGMNKYVTWVVHTHNRHFCHKYGAYIQ